MCDVMTSTTKIRYAQIKKEPLEITWACEKLIADDIQTLGLLTASWVPRFHFHLMRFSYSIIKSPT